MEEKITMVIDEISEYDVSYDFPEVRKIVDADATTKAVAGILTEQTDIYGARNY